MIRGRKKKRVSCSRESSVMSCAPRLYHSRSGRHTRKDDVLGDVYTDTESIDKENPVAFYTPNVISAQLSSTRSAAPSTRFPCRVSRIAGPRFGHCQQGNGAPSFAPKRKRWDSRDRGRSDAGVTLLKQRVVCIKIAHKKGDTNDEQSANLRLALSLIRSSFTI